MKRPLEINRGDDEITRDSKRIRTEDHPHLTVDPLQPSEQNFFDLLFRNLDPIPKFKGNPEAQRKKIDGTYIIETVPTFQTFIQRLFENSYKDFVKCRFLLDLHCRLLFAREGTPSKDIPAHFQMLGVKNQLEAESVSAGNFKVNRKGEITYITHKSGDFRPSFESLIWVLGVIVANNLPLSETVTIMKLTASGGFEKEIEIPREIIISKVNEIFDPTRLASFKQINSSLSPITYTYKSDVHKPGRRSIPLSPVKQPSFFDKSPPIQSDLFLKTAVLGSPVFVPRSYKSDVHKPERRSNPLSPVKQPSFFDKSQPIKSDLSLKTAVMVSPVFDPRKLSAKKLSLDEPAIESEELSAI